MDQQNSTTTTAPTPPIPSTEQPPTQPQPQPQSQPQPPPPAPPSAATPSSTAIPPPSPNPNPNPKPSTPSSSSSSSSLPQPRPPSAAALTPRPWSQPFAQHYQPPSSPAPPSPSPRGGIAIGVPAHHPSAPPPSQPTPYTSSYGQHFGGLGRGPVPEPLSNSSPSQVRPSMQGMGMMGGPMGSGSPMRPAGATAHRPAQTSFRPPSTASNPSPSSQNFQGHAPLRVSSLGSSSSPNTSQGMPPHTQPWLASGSQGKPPIPSPSYRQQLNSPSLQQRSHLPQQQHHPLPTASQPQHQGPLPTPSQQQQMSSVQLQQPPSSHQGHDTIGQQAQSSKVPQATQRQQQNTRVQSAQKSSTLTVVQPNTVQSSPQSRIATAEPDETGNRILSKRTIHELVNQIDPSEKLDPDVEDILMDIADEFVESITTFSCSLAKHRKSSMLEAKDILLHLEKNWNINLPGFGGDEIKGYRKPNTNDIHKGRIAAIRKSMVATETANTRNSTGQASGNAKGGVAKAPANISSQNMKLREVA